MLLAAAPIAGAWAQEPASLPAPTPLPGEAATARLLPAASPIARAASPDSATANRAFFTSYDALLAGGFVLGTIALLPFDRDLASNFRQQVNQSNPNLRDAASVFNFIGDPGVLIIGSSLYLTGRLAGRPRAARIGLHGTEAIILGGAITNAVKFLTGRARPYLSSDSTPDDFAFLRGFRGNRYQSFPSGHVTAAFAFASAVTAETSHWVDQADAWPGWKLVVGTTLYGGAAMVGMARMYDDRHWASDVLVGAAIGTFSGIKVVRYAYRNPDNPVDRWLLGTRVLPGPEGGAVLAWSLPTPF